MRVALFGLSEDLAYVVNGSLNLLHSVFFCMLHHQDDADHSVGGNNVEQQGLPFTWSGEDSPLESRRLRSSKADWASSVHSKESDFLRNQ